MKAMILAAGLGTRLQPFSLKRPKSLFPIFNRPLLLLTIERLKRAGFDTIIVNTHHLGDQISLALQAEKGIILQQESEILGTGGGLRQAREHFGAEPVLVVNSDIYHTIDYLQIYRQHYNAGGRVTLVLHDYPRFNNVIVNDKSQVVGFGSKNDAAETPFRRLAFTGIHVIHPDILLRIPQGTFSSIIECYCDRLREGLTINSLEVKNIFWTDIGSLSDYLNLHEGLLTGLVPPYKELGFFSEAGPFCVDENAVMGNDVRMKDWVYVGPNASVGDNALLRRVVVWDGADIAPGAELSDTIAA